MSRTCFRQEVPLPSGDGTSLTRPARRCGDSATGVCGAACACGARWRRRGAAVTVRVRPTAGGPGCRLRPLPSRRVVVVGLDHRDAGRRPMRAAIGGAAAPIVERAVLRLPLLPPREQRRGDEDRRVRADEQTDGEREREVLERGRAEDRRRRRSAATSTGSSATNDVESERISTGFSDRFTISRVRGPPGRGAACVWFSLTLSNTTTVS